MQNDKKPASAYKRVALTRGSIAGEQGKVTAEITFPPIDLASATIDEVYVMDTRATMPDESEGEG